MTKRIGANHCLHDSVVGAGNSKRMESTHCSGTLARLRERQEIVFTAQSLRCKLHFFSV